MARKPKPKRRAALAVKDTEETALAPRRLRVAATMSGAGLGFRRRDHNNSEAIAEILHPNEGYRCVSKDYRRKGRSMAVDG